MKEVEWKELEELWEKVRNGDREAFSAACDIVDSKLKGPVKAILRESGVRQTQSVEDAWQEAMVAFVKHHRKVRKIRSLPYWLAKTALRAAWTNRWPRYSKKKKPAQAVEQPHQVPGPVGAKPMTVAGREYQVKIYAPGDPTAAPSEPRPRLEPLTQSNIEKFGKTIIPDYVELIHQERALAAASAELQEALKQLPPRWRLAIELVYFEEKSLSEAAKVLECGQQRIYKILKMAKRRLRELLGNCAREYQVALTVSVADATRLVDRGTWVVGAYHDEISREIDSSEPSGLAATDVWWPLVLEALRRHTHFNASSHLIFADTADLGGNAPEDHGSGLLNCF